VFCTYRAKGTSLPSGTHRCVSNIAPPGNIAPKATSLRKQHRSLPGDCHSTASGASQWRSTSYGRKRV